MKLPPFSLVRGVVGLGLIAFVTLRAQETDPVLLGLLAAMVGLGEFVDFAKRRNGDGK